MSAKGPKKAKFEGKGWQNFIKDNNLQVGDGVYSGEGKEKTTTRLCSSASIICNLRNKFWILNDDLIS